MKIFKVHDKILIEHQGNFHIAGCSWDELVNHKNLYQYLLNHISSCKVSEPIDFDQPLDPPIGSQELWAAGVTYLRSKEARAKESAHSNGSSFYDRVYDAKRPELFFKSPPSRISGHHAEVHIRRDSTWDVPEPELTLFICSEGTIEGYTIGNDMSSRSIEGENPLYLAQAKIYDKAASLGPCLLVLKNSIETETKIDLKIFRRDERVFKGETSLSKMKRSLTELADFLIRETGFPKGVMLMTGTGVVPPDDFTLEVEDRIEICIEGIGTLINYVNKKH